VKHCPNRRRSIKSASFGFDAVGPQQFAHCSMGPDDPQVDVVPGKLTMQHLRSREVHVWRSGKIADNQAERVQVRSGRTKLVGGTVITFDLKQSFLVLGLRAPEG